MAIFDGQTTANPYVFDAPGNPYYDIVPLLTVGDEIPLLGGNLNNLSKVQGETFAFAGTPDGMGVFETQDYNYVFINHEFGPTATSYLNSTEPDVIKGARVSLLQFDKDWNIVGGKNLIETVVDNATGKTYSLNNTTGLYTDPTGATFSFNRFCSAYLAQSGFEGGPIYFGPEEGNSTSRGWAIDGNGVAQSIEGLGRYAKENILAASQYRADNSDKTVLISTEDNSDGEIYMFVGQQTADDPNGFKKGDLYVLKVQGADYETIAEGIPTNATWTKISEDAQLDPTGQKLISAVNAPGVSTNFRRPEDIAEDPIHPGTFYFVTTGSTDKIPGTDTVDNLYGKLYRFSLNPTDPTGSISNFELLLTGGRGTGVSYDNVVVDRNGNVLIQEDETAGSSAIMAAENRDARVWSYNIATDTVIPLFQLDQTAANVPGFTPGQPGLWETSGVIEVDPNALPGQSSYLFDVQAHGVPSSRYVEGGQLLLAVPIDPILGTSGAENLYGTGGDDYIYGLGGNDQIFGSEGNNKLYGGDGDDILYGGSKADRIDGGTGNDTIFASEGNNTVLGGSGNDAIYTGSGSDLINSGAGNDTIWLGGGQDIVVLAKGNGVDTINNFQLGQTQIGLSGGLRFSDLAIAQDTGATLIEIAATGEDLARLSGVQANSINASNFVIV